MARGVVLAACAETHVPATEVHFRVARQATIGSACRREDVVPFVYKSGLEIPRRPRGGVDFDVANAIVLGLYGLRECQKDLSSCRASRRPCPEPGLGIPTSAP